MDIVERLRAIGSCLRGPCIKVQEDAAKEIERLRSALEVTQRELKKRIAALAK